VPRVRRLEHVAELFSPISPTRVNEKTDAPARDKRVTKMNREEKRGKQTSLCQRTPAASRWKKGRCAVQTAEQCPYGQSIETARGGVCRIRAASHTSASIGARASFSPRISEPGRVVKAPPQICDRNAWGVDAVPGLDTGSLQGEALARPIKQRRSGKPTKPRLSTFERASRPGSDWLSRALSDTLAHMRNAG